MCHTSHSRLVVSSDLVGRLVADIQQTPDGVRLEGVLDGRSVSDARTALNDALEAVTGDVVVDLRQLVALDATSLALLVSVHRRTLNQGRRLVLDGVGPRLARLLAVTRLHRVLVVQRVPSAPVTDAERAA
jgi:anti-sigma B factor antagonist